MEITLSWWYNTTWDSENFKINANYIIVKNG
jgi:hypothetical protein